MNKKLTIFALALALASCREPNLVNQTTETAAVLPAKQQAESIPSFTPAEYTHISMPTFSELGGSRDAIADAQKTALYKMHAQNKDIDGLQSRNYSKAFLNDIITTAAPRANKLFPLYAEALNTAQYDLARLHGRINNDTLFNIKLDLMPQLTQIFATEKARYGKEQHDTDEMLYRITYMGEKQLREIITLLEKQIPTAFPKNDRTYGANVASQISNVSAYLGWMDGLKMHGVQSQFSYPFFMMLDDDTHRMNDQKRRNALAAASVNGF